MEAYTSTLSLLTHSLTDSIIFLLSYLKLIPGFFACYILSLTLSMI